MRLIQLMGLVFEQPMLFDDFAIVVDGRVVGDIRSQVWSSRHLKHLAMVMMKREAPTGILPEPQRSIAASATTTIIKNTDPDSPSTGTRNRLAATDPRQPPIRSAE